MSAFKQLTEKRRSVYSLNKELPISNKEVISIVEHAVKHSPSAFNSQSARVIVLLNGEHDKLWAGTTEILREIVKGDFSGTEARMNGFKEAAGTVLFFEDQDVIKKLQEGFPLYAENFPIWSEHSTAINQFNVWTALTEQNVGSNLQHYNPLIDGFVAKEWNIPSNWKLRAQLVFGGIKSEATEKEFATLESRIQVFGE